MNQNNENHRVVTDDTLSSLVGFLEIQQNGRAAYSNQVWNRFNWFLTLQLAIIGFYFSQFEFLSTNEFLLKATPAVGVVGSIVWLLLGYEDFRSLKRHSRSTAELESAIAAEFIARHVNFPPAQEKSAIRFRQNWLLFLYPSIFVISWCVLYWQLIK